VDGRTALCVLTHDPKFDVPLLEVALTLPEVGYIGAMGSRRTHEDRLTRLREVGTNRGRAEAAIVLLVDLPDVGAETVARVVDLATPTVLARIIHTASGDRRARDYLRQQAVQPVPWDDLATGRDVDPPRICPAASRDPNLRRSPTDTPSRIVKPPSGGRHDDRGHHDEAPPGVRE